jgi:transcriptional regulator with XRE-family HTH domain
MKPTNAIDRHVGKCLRRLRLARGMDLPGLSSLLGVSTPRLLQLEEGRERISAELMRQLARILNVPPSAFFAGFSKNDASATKDPADRGIGAQDEEQRLLRDFARIRDAKSREIILALVASYADFNDLDEGQTPSGH